MCTKDYFSLSYIKYVFSMSLLALHIGGCSLQVPEFWQIAKLGPSVILCSSQEKEAIVLTLYPLTSLGYEPINKDVLYSALPF